MAVEDFHPPQLPPFIAFKDPSNSKIWGYTHINVAMVTCHGGVGLSSEGHSMLYGPYIKSLRSWDGSGGLSSTSTTTICSFQGPSNSKIWGYTHINVAMVTCHGGVGLSS